MTISRDNEECAATFTPAYQYDLDADGRSEVIWHHRLTGLNSVWHLNPVTGALEAVDSLTRGPGGKWRLVAKGDFDHDGRLGLLWRNLASGRNLLWSVSGTTRTGASDLPAETDLAWRIAGAADVNGDGWLDLVWTNTTTGANRVWYGRTFTTGDALPTQMDTAWTLEGVGDFDADGVPDLVWRNPQTGITRVWLMSGLSKIGEQDLTYLPGASWRIADIADFNGDAKPDLFWRNYSTGDNYIWYMDGLTCASTRSGTWTPPAT